MHWLLTIEHFAEYTIWVALIAALHFAVQFALGLRVVMQRRPTGETLAWLMLLFTVPIVGIAAYLIFGELRLGRRRERRYLSLFHEIGRWLGELSDRAKVDWAPLGSEMESVALMSERTVGLPALPGNAVELLHDWREVFSRLLVDIDAAQRTCHLEFYIWNDGGEADRVVDALIRAAQRGVTCRVLVDSLGSRRFYKGPSAQRLRDAGVQLQDALPGGLLRLPFVRFDLRLHRKIVVIDGRIAYTGSLNLVDPRHFKKDAGVGEWVDAMVRIEGPAVEALAILFLSDWYVESNDDLEELRKGGDAGPQPSLGDCVIQVLPSGPALAARTVEQILLTAVYAARREIVLTTPYFVPSEPLSMALVAAARRGVNVVLVVPRRIDSKLVRYASAAYCDELMAAGVKVAGFNKGLLHTKSVTVDGRVSLFGSVNLDPRSFRLNFEILLALYDQSFSAELRELQQRYIDASTMLDLSMRMNRPHRQRVAEAFARLLGPVL